MEHGDHVRVMGRDGLYVFVKEVQGTATLRLGSTKRRDETPPYSIPIDRVFSLEQTNVPCPHPSRD